MYIYIYKYNIKDSISQPACEAAIPICGVLAGRPCTGGLSQRLIQTLSQLFLEDFQMSVFGDFEHHLPISVGDYTPNSWVMFNWDIYQPLDLLPKKCCFHDSSKHQFDGEELDFT